MKNNLIYLDHAATTPLRSEVLDEMMPYLTRYYGNPSSVYELGLLSKKAIELARKRTADAISAEPNEIYFTSGGSESDNWALFIALENSTFEKKHIISTQIEHHAILHTMKNLKNVEVTFLPVDKFGLVDPTELKKAIRKNTVLISIMYANNEIGTIQDIATLSAIAKEHNILFHTDAVQAIGQIDIDCKKLPIDMLSLSAHKFYGPKGVGALFVRKNTIVKPFILGGAQERSKRAGTENVAGIVGLGKAIELAVLEMEHECARLCKLRDKLIENMLSEMPFVTLNGHPTKRLANNVNLSFQFVEGESILMLLDLEKICASSGSACTSGSLDPSHVLLATGLSHELAHGSVRMTLGKSTTEEEIDVVTKKMPLIIDRLRAMSPLYEEYMKKKA